jgi:hypothetical protein|tara:strand:+ start:1677 stop:1886 length:210 start_codon:yes stop_codon:yes gene_type:complete
MEENLIGDLKMAKKLENLIRAKERIKECLEEGNTDNIKLFKLLKKERLGLRTTELIRLINKQCELNIGG